MGSLVSNFTSMAGIIVSHTGRTASVNGLNALQTRYRTMTKAYAAIDEISDVIREASIDDDVKVRKIFDIISKVDEHEV